ncbi:hypothetical protein Bca52824_095939, partial [Brassica carinata]
EEGEKQREIEDLRRKLAIEKKRMNQNKLCSLTELLLLVILVLLLSTFFLVFFLAGSKRKSSRLMLDSKRKLNWCVTGLVQGTIVMETIILCMPPSSLIPLHNHPGMTEMMHLKREMLATLQSNILVAQEPDDDSILRTRTYDVSITDYLEDSVENPEEEEGEQDLIFDYEPSKAIERKMIFEAEEERGIDSGRAIRDLSASPVGDSLPLRLILPELKYQNSSEQRQNSWRSI